jgi:hypothetical protein
MVFAGLTLGFRGTLSGNRSGSAECHARPVLPETFRKTFRKVSVALPETFRKGRGRGSGGTAAKPRCVGAEA